MNHDIFFISYNESNQEANWAQLLMFHPTAKRIHGVKGIDKVHVTCDQLATTEWFWTVDGDNWLAEPLIWEEEKEANLLMFHAYDPITLLWTKLGGVKLWKTGSLINKDMSKGDFCLNATESKLSPKKAFSFTNYNASPYEAWKTSFRHCVKLLSVIIRSRPLAANIDFYIDHWKGCELLDNGENNAKWAYQGYCDAKAYVEIYDNQLDQLYKINDYDWLKHYFESRHA